ncbi:large conductance mechanosensitive channel protein MscL [Streptococcus acidominimus]|uniref:Large-conductance mechanosensitive channel n=1 Tax=Streptococcus acidominimus TaxID=1326 RepID=A0A1Q8EDP2_STRAI|nr:large conductance mechanosensitive channel protein MscL [Streptococcus acidominimus]MBF0847471.1 large conductance mechanosensitive channel protein MscL [Streptococcus danieliae]MBF0818000.1 large conductance mechanosensitive channel protein MscL [Streptococcus acidominimus]MBF0839706.1 large conductance mechanosensitive channel protein MscL [Streptococcus acidominimus]OLF49936.1 large-conductance mechanosensitive channel [Streptococcus acidominimus]TFU31722.1 large conductance mechanosensi
MLKDLKAFLLRGNVVDLAVGVIIASAFGDIITSMVNDVITPLFLNPALKAAGAEKIAELSWNGVAYGNFLSSIINFVIVGTVLFFIVKAMEKAQSLTKKQEATDEAAAAEVAGPSQEELLAEIRDLLKNK